MEQHTEVRSSRMPQPSLLALQDRYEHARSAFTNYVTSLDVQNFSTESQIAEVLQHIETLFTAVTTETVSLTSILKKHASTEEANIIEESVSNLSLQKNQVINSILLHQSQIRKSSDSTITPAINPQRSNHNSPKRSKDSKASTSRHSKSISSEDSDADNNPAVQLAQIALERARLEVRERKARSRLGLSHSSKSSYKRIENWVDDVQPQSTAGHQINQTSTSMHNYVHTNSQDISLLPTTASTNVGHHSMPTTFDPHSSVPKTEIPPSITTSTNFPSTCVSSSSPLFGTSHPHVSTISAALPQTAYLPPSHYVREPQTSTVSHNFHSQVPLLNSTNATPHFTANRPIVASNERQPQFSMSFPTHPVSRSTYTYPSHHTQPHPPGFPVTTSVPLWQPPNSFAPISTAYRGLSQQCNNPPVTVQQNTLCDGSTRFLMIAELKKVPAHPFKGEAHQYMRWINNLTEKFVQLSVPALDAIETLSNHSEGEPHNLIKNMSAIVGSNPSQQLEDIKSELHRRFGSSQRVAQSLYEQLIHTPDVRGSEGDSTTAIKLRQFSDACRLVRYHMEAAPDLQILNFAIGLDPIRRKLPHFVNNAWRKRKTTYENEHSCHPNFIYFCEFLNELSTSLCSEATSFTPIIKNSFTTNGPRQNSKPAFKEKNASVLLTSTTSVTCPFHQSNNHSIQSCKAIANLTSDKKRTFIKEHNLCFRCLGSHMASDCKEKVSCETCKSKGHSTFAHYGSSKPSNKGTNRTPKQHETSKQELQPTNTSPTSEKAPASNTLCTRVCNSFNGKDCSKTLLVNVYYGNTSCRAYAIIDECSTKSFCTSSLLDSLKAKFPTLHYDLHTLSGTKTRILGRCATGLKIRGVLSDQVLELPELWENNYIPDTKSEVATKDIVSKTSAAAYAQNFPPFDKNAEVSLLIGRNGHSFMNLKVHRNHLPYVHETPLGFAIVGSICPQSFNSSCNHATVNKISAKVSCDHFSANPAFEPAIEKDVFVTHPDDDLPGLSIEDKKFLQILDDLHVNKTGHLEAPLPFRNPDSPLPDNRSAVFHRQSTTLSRIRRNADLQAQCQKAMQVNIDAGHVEQVDKPNIPGEMWYLPVFPVTHPRKLKIRLVFDSAAKFSGVSLNSRLLPGPDLNNKLRGVLTKFREDRVGFAADIEMMFHSFHVTEHHRDKLRFFWWQDNNPSKPMVTYRAKVHIFGNTSSPAIATLCLHKAANFPHPDLLEDRVWHLYDSARDYIKSHFYCDDGLGTAPNAMQAIETLQRSRDLLSRLNIHLHKIVSSSQDVIKAFPSSEVATSPNVDLSQSSTHRTLGVSWNTEKDVFTIQVDIPQRSFTKRGVLSVVNSVYDPIGVASPVVLGGRLFLREILQEGDNSNKNEWDALLPAHHHQTWTAWMSSLQTLDDLSIPRCFFPRDFEQIISQDLHVFADASQKAIGNVTYLRSIDLHGSVHVSFVHGESRVAPKAATSIPRLELCAAVAAITSCKQTLQELKNKPDNVFYYSDSQVVLAYIQNTAKRFAGYIQRRVDAILNFSTPDQWSYVATGANPADLASRSTDPLKLQQSHWLNGPPFLLNKQDKTKTSSLPYAPIDSILPEEVPSSIALLSAHTEPTLFFNTCQRVSKYSTILRVAARVLMICKLWRAKANNELVSTTPTDPILMQQAHHRLIFDAQSSNFHDVISTLNKKCELPPEHKLVKLSPFIDKDGLLRVGGRLRLAHLSEAVKHPLLLPSNDPLTAALLLHYHKKTLHQGRHITHGAIREAGYHIECGRKVINRLLNNCVTCRRLRAQCETPQMADLPLERMTPTPPFTAVGLDVFGFFMLANGPRTRKNASLRKCWVLLCTCLASRAVHLEILPSMDTPTFINAFKRFTALRGPCKLIRSDQGTNFIGAKNEAEALDVQSASKALLNLGATWVLNPPHASHFGGCYERKIGQIRRCLDAALLYAGSHPLTYDEFSTLLQECAAIVNSTPLWEVSYNPNDPFPVTPYQLLTQKSGPLEQPLQEEDVATYATRQWRRTQQLADQFWIAWRKGYLLNLVARNKWPKKSSPLQVGDIVLVKDKLRKRASWPTGVVEETKCSHDDIVRSVFVHMGLKKNGVSSNTKLLERPVSDLVLLHRPKSS